MAKKKTGEFKHSRTVSIERKVNLGNYESLGLFESATTKYDDEKDADKIHAQLVAEVENSIGERLVAIGKKPEHAPEEPEKEVEPVKAEPAPGPSGERFVDGHTEGKDDLHEAIEKVVKKANGSTQKPVEVPDGFQQFDASIDPYRLAKDIYNTHGYAPDQFKQLGALVRIHVGHGENVTPENIAKVPREKLAAFLLKHGLIREKDG